MTVLVDSEEPVIVEEVAQTSLTGTLDLAHFENDAHLLFGDGAECGLKQCLQGVPRLFIGNNAALAFRDL